jgi:hypothetical protein
MTTEGIDEPQRALEDALQARNIPQSRFRTLDFGESMRPTISDSNFDVRRENSSL